MKNRILAIIVPVILLVGGVMFIALGAINLNQVKSFPQVDATVTNLEEEVGTDPDMSDVNETVTVQYVVNGKSYEEVLQFHETGKYRVGDVITVRYDPEKPNYVTAGSNKTSVIYVAVGALFALGGLAMLIKLLVDR